MLLLGSGTDPAQPWLLSTNDAPGWLLLLAPHGHHLPGSGLSLCFTPRDTSPETLLEIKPTGCRPGSLPSSHARLPFPGTHPGERGRGQVREGCARHQPRRSRCGRASPGWGPARAQLERAAASPGCEAKPEHDGTPLATETSCTSPTPFARCRGGRLAQRCRGQRAGTPRAASLLPTPPVLQRRAACRRRVAPGCPNSACPEVLWPRASLGSVCPQKFGMRQGCEGKSADVPRMHAGIFLGGLVHTRAALP